MNAVPDTFLFGSTMPSTSRSLLLAALVCLFALPSVSVHAQVTLISGGYSGAFKAGESLEMYLYFYNQGTTEAHDLVLTITGGAGLHFASVTSKSAPVSCAPSGSDLVCTEAALASHNSFYVDTQFTSDASLQPDFRTTFSIRMTVGGTSVYASTNSTYVAGPIDAKIELSPAPPLTAGLSINMEATITNNGPYNLYDPNIVLKGSFGKPVDVLSNDQGCDDLGGDTLTCKYALLLAPGASKKIAFSVYGKPSEKGPGTVTGSVDPRNDDTATENNTAVRTVLVSSIADVKTSIESSRFLTVIGAGAADPTIRIYSQSSGPSDTGHGTLTYDLPAGIAFQSLKSAHGAPSCTTPAVGQAGRITCTDDTAIFDVTITERPVATGTYVHTAAIQGETQDPQASNNTASTNTQAVAPPDVSITIRATPEHPRKGAIVTFFVTVKNDGQGTADFTTIRHAYSAGLQFVDVQTQGSPDKTIQLLAGQSAELPARFYVTATTGSVSDAVTVTAQNELNTSNNTARADVVISQADLAVTLRADRTSAAPGERVIYTATITNKGPDRATNVVLTDVLPNGATAVGAAINGGTCTTTSGVICHLDGLDSGASTSATIAVNAAATPGEMHNDATIASDAFDPHTQDNAATMPLTIVAPAQNIADLSLDMNASPSTVTAGANLTFTVNLRNVGTATANGIEVVAVFPTAITPQSASTPCTIVDQTLRCSVPSLAASGLATFTVNTFVRAAGTITTNAIVTSTSNESSTANNVASAVVTSNLGRPRGARH